MAVPCILVAEEVRSSSNLAVLVNMGAFNGGGGNVGEYFKGYLLYTGRGSWREVSQQSVPNDQNMKCNLNSSQSSPGNERMYKFVLHDSKS